MIEKIFKMIKILEIGKMFDYKKKSSVKKRNCCGHSCVRYIIYVNLFAKILNVHFQSHKLLLLHIKKSIFKYHKTCKSIMWGVYLPLFYLCYMIEKEDRENDIVYYTDISNFF